MEKEHESRDADVESLLADALERLEVEGAAGLETFLGEHPARADELRAHLARLHGLGLTAPAGGADADDAPFPEQLGDFRLLERLGQGGMGVVFRAVQISLGREVAIKLIRPEQLFFAGARERFQREVEIVARMQHPGIVPIHAVGAEAGVPFFAMELVRGATLADVLEEVHGADPARLDGRDLDRAIARRTGDTSEREPAPAFRGPWTSVVLRLLREVAEALEHAHRRGVLHRDVKPSNVLITREGRVMLLDFGLSSAAGNARLTRTGSQLGSLAYMAPERLKGDAAAEDVRADVYSLGATLWEALALRLPHATSDPLKLYELAMAASRPPLASVSSAVSWEIETVCATAMDPDPARRYASAALFAHDLDNVLAHRPIQARRAGALLRARRWAQRHPARATATAAAILALTVGPSVFGWQEWRKRRVVSAQRDALDVANAELERQQGELRATNAELERARDRAAAEAERARRNFDRLVIAVDTMLKHVGSEDLRDVPRMERVREKLLGEARRFYEEFLREQPDDPALRREAADVLVRAGDVDGYLGEYGVAEERLVEAIGLLEQVALDDPDSGADLEIAVARVKLGAAQRLQGKVAEGRASVEQAIEALVALGDAPRPPRVAQVLGDARLERAQGQLDAGDLAGASEELARAIGELEFAAPSLPEDLGIGMLLARALDRRAVATCQLAFQTSAGSPRGRALLEEAASQHRRARELWPLVLEATPDDAQVRTDAARNAHNLALALQYLGDTDGAIELYRESVAATRALADDFPTVPQRQADLGNAYNNLAGVLLSQERAREAGEEYARAAEIWDRLLAERPDEDPFAFGSCVARQGEALVVWTEGDPERARPLLARAAETCDRALTARPGDPTYRRARRQFCAAQAELALELQDHEAAVEAARGLVRSDLAPGEPARAADLIAGAVPLVEADARLSPEARAELATALAEEAFALVRGAALEGTPLAVIERDAMLERARALPGFEELVSSLRSELAGGR